METWLLLTAYRKLPAPYRMVLSPNPTTYRLAAIPHDLHIILRFQGYPKGMIFMLYESQYAISD